ncbi:MAG: aminotransferase class III-fold pyridoxal phosphate-dependent enzyme [Actinomycetota bacterium]|nr:aminotransferase class III-fold pyridoxal phosphate-dependent enzyme [Actinomycetota bacterium]
MSDGPVTEVYPDREAVQDVYRRHLSSGRATLCEVMGAPLEVRSSGAYVYAPDGTAYLNCGGYGVFIVGHCHPLVVEAVVDQARRHPIQTHALVEPVQAAAAEALLEVVPPELDSLRFTNSGAECTEAGLKMARLHGKKHIVTMRNGFHGKTLGALSATANPLYQDPFAPLLPSTAVPFGDAAALEAVIAGRDDCCVIVEPIQGEGGAVIPPPGYLSEVVALCRRHEAFVIFDEIQSGLGRTGRWWASQRDADAIPDIMLVGKGLSGGVVPVGAVLARSAIYRPFGTDLALHSSTFAGSPIQTAAAHATIRAIESEGLVERARDLGAELLALAREIAHAEAADMVRDVRGEGLLIGIEFADPSLVVETMQELMQRRVIANNSVNAVGVLRLTPPAVLEPSDIERLGDALVGGFRAAAAVL